MTIHIVGGRKVGGELLFFLAIRTAPILIMKCNQHYSTSSAKEEEICVSKRIEC